MKVALYARVSKALEQNPENQLIELRKWALAAGHVVEGEYVDEVSSKDTRPQKEAVLRKLRLGLLDGVAFWALDRWGRNMSELVLELEEFTQAGKKLVSVKEALDYTTAIGKLHAHVLASFANFEREKIRERTLLGLARARAQGKKLGRPRKYPQDATWSEKLSPKQRSRFDARKLAREAKARDDVCVRCGSKRNLEGHHVDYSKPGQVVTLCQKCHWKAHGKRGGANPGIVSEEKKVCQ